MERGRKKTTIIILGVAGGLLLAGLIASIIKILIFGSFEIVAGAIRPSASGWSVIEDDTHKPVGIKDVVIEDNTIVISFDNRFSTIHTFVISLDEALASRGYFIGSSVGRSKANIRIYKAENGAIERVNPSEVTGVYTNIWIYGLFE